MLSPRSRSGDYVAKISTLTFAPGETTKTITIVVNGDSKKEANETFDLDLFGLSSIAIDHVRGAGNEVVSEFHHRSTRISSQRVGPICSSALVIPR